jgi:hypothetical protein
VSVAFARPYHLARSDQILKPAFFRIPYAHNHAREYRNYTLVSAHLQPQGNGLKKVGVKLGRQDVVLPLPAWYNGGNPAEYIRSGGHTA